MLPSEGSVLGALEAAPDKRLAYFELLQKFEISETQNVDLLKLLWSMRNDPGCPLKFEDGWIDLSEIVVYLEE